MDLTSVQGLAWAENVTAAVARAMSAEEHLRYRGHILGTDRVMLPSRAPHTNPPLENLKAQDLRGSADGVVQRMRYSSAEVYASHLPGDDVSCLVFEVLEQFRVESLVPGTAIGMQANIEARFDTWSHEVVGAGLLDTDIGLLLFAVIQVCRSRILSRPINDRFNDLTEATRFGIYETLGPHLVHLRNCVERQGEFAEHASALARAVSALVAARGTTAKGGGSAPALLAMLTGGGSGESSESGGESSEEPGGPGSGYRVYTRQFDQVVCASEYAPLHAQRQGRTELDGRAQEHRMLLYQLRRGFHDFFAEEEEAGWEGEREAGYIDPRLLAGLATSSGHRDIFMSPATEPLARAAVSILVDCSGSMKGVMPSVALWIDLLVRALDALDVDTEVLGFTTGSWCGGKPHRQWIRNGGPAHPGRLNETLHVIFKASDTTYSRARLPLGALMWTPMFREGIDGEALDFAAARLSATDAERKHLLLISDGSPRDSATELVNPDGYLDQHLIRVAKRIERSADIHLAGIGIGHDMSSYLTNTTVIEPENLLVSDSARVVRELLKAYPRQF